MDPDPGQQPGEHEGRVVLHLDAHVDREDQGVDPQEHEGVQEGPQETQDRAPVADLELLAHQVADQAPVADQVAYVADKTGHGWSIVTMSEEKGKGVLGWEGGAVLCSP